MRVRSTMIALALCAPCAFACGSGDPTVGTAAPPMHEAPPQAQTFTRTIVTLLPTGEHAVVSDVVTREQQVQEQQVLFARREALKNGTRMPETLTEYGDCIAGNPCSNCAGSNLITDLFDGTFGTGDEICFYNQGSSRDSAYLPNYVEYQYLCGTRRCTVSWNGANIQSYATNQNESSGIATCTGLFGCSCTNWGASGNLEEGSFSGYDYLMIEPDGKTCNVCGLGC